MRYRDQPNEEEEEDVLNISIVGDEEEQHRIELEQNLQNLSIQLSLSAPSQNDDADSSAEVEYPRHDPNPRETSVYRGGHSSLVDITPIDHNFDPTIYSYHALNNEDNSHFGGNTMSTAAHHASVVTLSAGLGNRPGKRYHPFEASLSGAEYDPDRPLDTVVNGMAEDLSMLNMKYNREEGTRRKVPCDSEKASKRTYDAAPELRSIPRKASDQPSRLDREPQPKLRRTKTTTESRVKRPDSTFANSNTTPVSNMSIATGGSKFTRLAKTLAKEIDASHRWVQAPFRHPSPDKRSRKRQTLKIKHPTKTIERRMMDENNDHLVSINLPDVTGLTSAAGSPPRREREWKRYTASNEDDRVEVKLVESLTALQLRLNQLESQNFSSRRRIRELELELETCKLEAKRERMRTLEKEEIIVAQQRDFQKRRSSSTRGRQSSGDGDRYQEIVEEKKALETLISKLRSHLTRTSEELARQQSQLNELQRLREIDARNLEHKLLTIESLKDKMEKIGQEVETLRGVVEEGLMERKRAKEDASLGDVSMSSQRRTAFDRLVDGDQTAILQSQESVRDSRNLSRADIPSPPPSHPSSPQRDSVQTKDRGKLRFAVRTQERFIDNEELDRLSAELEERRSVRSQSDNSQINDQRRPKARQERTGSTADAALPHVETEQRKRKKATKRMPHARTDGINNETLPHVRGDRLEQIFLAAPTHDEQTCRLCHRRQRPSHADDELDFPSILPPRKRTRLNQGEAPYQRRLSNGQRPEGRESSAPFDKGSLPPQTVLARVLSELEDEFTHYKGIYCELAEQYNLMDAMSNVPKRNALAEHLKEVVDTLEQKGDQIASLYELLSFKDKSDYLAAAQRATGDRSAYQRG